VAGDRQTVASGGMGAALGAPGGSIMKIAVIGGGSWGTTLADLLAKKGHESRLWVREQAVMTEIRTTRENSWYLPGRKLSDNLEVSTDAAAVADDAKYLEPEAGRLRFLRRHGTG